MAAAESSAAAGGLSPELQQAAAEVNLFSASAASSAAPSSGGSSGVPGLAHVPSNTPLPANAASYTGPLTGCGLSWNPFHEQLLAVASSQNFGVIGSGKLQVLSWRGGSLSHVASLDTKDSMFACAWSEEVDSQLVFGLGDGSVTLWDYKTDPAGGAQDAGRWGSEAASGGRILQNFQPHTAEVYSIDWLTEDKSSFVTGSWDHTLRLYTPVRKAPIRTFHGHSDCVYGVAGHPNRAGQLASVAGDQSLRLWDTSDSRPVLTIPKAHEYEAMCVDWHKYDEYCLATGGVDALIRIWDIRQPKTFVDSLAGHQFTVRTLKWSPHNPRALASGSYDMTVKLWDTERSKKAAAEDHNTLVASYEQHTEFVLDLGWNLHRENVLASTSWDQQTFVWSVKDLARRI